MIGRKTIRLQEVDSTNRYVIDRISKEKIEEGTLVFTDFQTAGRGLDKNSWESERGANLLFSFVIYPYFLAIEEQFYLNKIISLAIVDFAGLVMPRNKEIRIKWPNDVYIGDGKVAGILIQNGIRGHSFEYSVIGAGININQELFTSDAPNPVSFKMVAGRNFDLDEMMGILTDRLNKRYDQLKEGVKNEIDQDYVSLLYRYGKLASFIYKGNPVTARIRGVSRFGHLLLEIQGKGIVECDLKELKFET